MERGNRFSAEFAQESFDSTGFRLGQRVVHAKFGEGTVLNYEGVGHQSRIQVNFDEVGSKWLVVAPRPLATGSSRRQAEHAAMTVIGVAFRLDVDEDDRVGKPLLDALIQSDRRYGVGFHHRHLPWQGEVEIDMAATPGATAA